METLRLRCNLAYLVFHLQLHHFLQLDHVSRVLSCNEEKAELETIWLGHHLADKLVVGEHRRATHGTVVVNALTTNGKLLGKILQVKPRQS